MSTTLNQPNDADASGNLYSFFEPFPTKNNKKYSTGMIVLGIILYLICGLLIPSCILFFITKWSAKSALNTSPCGNALRLKTLINSASSQ